MCEEGRIASVARSLLVPPNAELVSRAANDVGMAIAVHVISKHVGASLAQLGGMKLPRFIAPGADATRLASRLLPPAAGANDIEPAIAVDIADPKAVRIPLCPRNFFARLARDADR